METTRQQKIAKQIQKDVAEIFQKEGAALVRGLLVTVTGVRVSPDFGYAKIYVSVFPFDRSAELMKTLEHQNWFVRRALGQRLRNHVRVYLEAAATFSYTFSSRYENEQAREQGDPAWSGDYAY